MLRLPSTIGPPQPIGPGKVYLIHKADAAQTDVSHGAAWGAAQQSRLLCVDARGYRLGWGSRVPAQYESARRQRLLLWSGVGARSSIQSTAAGSARGGVQTDKTKESVVEFEKELRFIAGEKPVSDKELASAKQTLLRGYAQQFESLSRVSGQIAQLWSLSLPTIGDAARAGGTRTR